MPLRPNQTEKHYMFVSRIMIVIMIYGGIGMALYISNLLELFKYFISMPAIFGAPIWLGFMWRRLSRWAVGIQIVVSFIIIAIIPNVFQSWMTTRAHEPFLKQTVEQEITISTKALASDVEAGLADEVGQMISKQRVVPPYPLFFDRIARENPDDPNSRMIGYGRFNAEIWVVSLLGVDFSNFTKAQLVTVRFLFAALFPFFLLFVLSYITKPASKKTLDYFFSKIHTPVQPTPEQDVAKIQENADNMEQWESRKLFPKTHWEIHKPQKMDYIGFLGTWALVGVVILLLWLVVTIGS
jgi:SSS family solute:Na+ symporter